MSVDADHLTIGRDSYSTAAVDGLVSGKQGAVASPGGLYPLLTPDDKIRGLLPGDNIGLFVVGDNIEIGVPE
eukprot:630343-Alexandrium_andersonii.AAC.1